MSDFGPQFFENLENICIFGLCIFVYMLRRYVLAYSIYYKTYSKLDLWRCQNSNLSVGTSEVARNLLVQHLIAYDRLLEVDKMHWDNGYRDYLIRLFSEMPPRNSNLKAIRNKRKRCLARAPFLLHLYEKRIELARE